MNFSDVIVYLEQQASNLTVNHVRIDDRDLVTVGGIVTRADSESINHEKFHLIQSLKVLMSNLQLLPTDSLDTLSPLKKITVLHQLISNNDIDLGRIMLNHGINPTIAHPDDMSAIMLAVQLRRFTFLEEFGMMVHEVAPPPINLMMHAALQEQEPDSSNHQVTKREKFVDIPIAKSQHTFKTSPMQEVFQRYELEPADLIKPTQILLAQHAGKADLKLAPLPNANHEKVITQHFKVTVAKLTAHERLLASKNKAETPKNLVTDSMFAQWQKSTKKYQLLWGSYNAFFKISQNKIDMPLRPVRKPELDVFPATSSKVNVILPEDREVMAAGIALLRDYSTFSFRHPRRKFRKDAAALIDPYVWGNKTITKTDEFLAFYQVLQNELERVTGLPHNAKQPHNNSFNSSYCRRLKFITDKLSNTAVVVLRNNKDEYNKILDARFYAANLTVK
jgi:hypothetical protein